MKNYDLHKNRMEQLPKELFIYLDSEVVIYRDNNNRIYFVCNKTDRFIDSNLNNTRYYKDYYRKYSKIILEFCKENPLKEIVSVPIGTKYKKYN